MLSAGGSSTYSETDKRLKAAAESVFGTNPLPKLEKFTFKVCAVACHAKPRTAKAKVGKSPE